MEGNLTAPTTKEMPQKNVTAKEALADILQSAIVSIIICTIIYTFFFTPNIVLGESMENTFHEGELLLTNKVSQWLGSTDFGHNIGLDYQRGDVIVFQKPGRRDYIKRVIGLPGERVMVKDGVVYINGEQLTEKYLPSGLRTNGGTFLLDGEEKTVPEHHYFVMGDNRSNSQDSRYVEVGFVHRDWMKGKVIVRYWPPQQLGIIGQGDIETNN